MAVMKDLAIEIEELILNTSMSFGKIAEKLDIPLSMVYDVAELIGEFDE